MSERNEKVDSRLKGRGHGSGRHVILMIFLSVFALAVISLFLVVRVYDQGQELAELTRQVEELTRQMTVEGTPGTGTDQAVKDTLDTQEDTDTQEDLAKEDTRESIDSFQTEDPEGDKPGEEESKDPGQEAAHKVYLTFDDGPSIYTEEILDILDRYEIKATFFVVGKDTDRAREMMKEIVARGHTLGMHSYSHKYSEVYASVKAFSQDFAKLREYIYEVTGVESNVYRFPGGSSNTVSDIDMWEFADYLESQEVRFFDWNISSGDGGSQLLPVETLVENSTKGISGKKTSVVLMHDSADKRTTVEALPAIIEKILDMDDTVILPITDDTTVVQHIHRDEETEVRDGAGDGTDKRE